MILGKDVYIGAHRNDIGDFVWQNGTTNGTTEEFEKFTNWRSGEPNNWPTGASCAHPSDCNEKCAAYLGEHDSEKWFDVSCWDEYRFICQYDVDTEYCTEVDGSSLCLDGTMYNISETKAKYSEAQDSCMENEGTLVVIKTEKIKNLVNRLINPKSAPKLDPVVATFFQRTMFWGCMLQYCFVPIQLTIVIGLCMDNGTSLLSRFLRTKFMQFLGRISLSLYLLHMPVMAVFDVENIAYPPALMPIIMIIITPLFSFFVTKYFEEPMTKILKGE